MRESCYPRWRLLVSFVLPLLFLISGTKPLIGQDIVTWSDVSPVIVLSPGDALARTFTLTSSVDLGSVVASATPEISDLVQFDPGPTLQVSAGQPATLRTIFAVPQDLPTGKYIGEIHLRSDKVTISAPLQVIVQVKPPSLQYAVAVNKTDPLLASITSNKGVMVELFGEKDSSGLATALTGYGVTTPDGKSTIVSLDTRGRINLTAVPSGDTFSFNWTSDSHAIVTFVSADGHTQVNTAVDFPAALAKRFRHLPKKEAANCSPAFINVAHCGAPVNDALAYFKVSRSLTLFGPTTIMASSIDQAGNYKACIPTSDPDAGQGFRDKCESIVGFLDDGCTGTEIFIQSCPALILASAALGGEATGVVIAACEAAEAHLATACSFIGGPVEGAPSPWEAVCANVANAYNSFINRPVTLTPVATVPGAGTVTGASASIQAQGPFGSFSLQAPGSLSILSFTTAPVDPDPFQAYVATAEIGCAPPDTVVTVSISGTDGYQDSTECTVTGNGTCQLVVPGARAGIMDTLTVVANGVSRVIGIVF